MDVISTARKRISARAQRHLRCSALLAPLLREFDNQNGILRRQRNHHHQPDLSIEIEREFRDQYSADRSNYANDHREQDRDRDKG